MEHNFTWKNDGRTKVMIGCGTRPEIIRLAAVIKRCREYFDCCVSKSVWTAPTAVPGTLPSLCSMLWVQTPMSSMHSPSLISTVFIIWVILLVLPLFTELEFFGVKVKKEVKEAVEKSNKEVKDSINNLQQLVMQIQVSNNATNQLTINGNPLPSESRIEELTNAIQALTAQNKEKTNETYKDESSVPEQNVELFKIRYDIEMALRECVELLRLEPQTRMTTVSMARILNQRGLLDSTTTDTLIEIIRIANRAVHGEMLNQKYVGFVRKTYPGIMDELQKCKNRINMA